jgi:DNA gyrase/topoisomerase IV subunit B
MSGKAVRGAARKYNFKSFKEHAEKRAMWLGSKQVAESQYWLRGADGKFERRWVSISEALPKMVDEILINACDQYIRAAEEPQSAGGPVTYIKVALDMEKGEVTVRNNGRGISIYYDEEQKVWSVQGIVTKEYSGENFEDDPDQVTGGINGLGMKLINMCSEYFQIETVDTESGYYYKQRFRSEQGSKELTIEKPEVICISRNGTLTAEGRALPELRRDSHTTIRFLPRYQLLCAQKSGVWFNNENMQLFEKIIEARCYQISAFINSIDYRWVEGEYTETERPVSDDESFTPAPTPTASAKGGAKGTRAKKPKTRKHYEYVGGRRIDYGKAKVYFQGKLVECRGIVDFANMYMPIEDPTKVIHTKLTPDKNKASAAADDKGSKDKAPKMVVITLGNSPKIDEDESVIPYPWALAFTLSSNAQNGKYTKNGFEHVTIVNGLYMEESSTHVTNIMTILLNKLVHKAKDKLDMSEEHIKDILHGMLRLVNIRQIPVPQMASQSKTSLKLDARDQSIIRSVYRFSDAQITQIWRMIKKHFESLQLQNEYKDQKATISKIKVRKHIPPDLYGKRSAWKDLMLIPVEGDSAHLLIDGILSNSSTPVSYRTMGTYNLQGVPPNALKHIKEVLMDGNPVKVQNRVLANNIPLQNICNIMHLNYEYDYWYQGDYPTADPAVMTASDRLRREEGDRQWAELRYGKGVLIATDQDHDGIGQICSLVIIYFITFWPELIKRGLLKRMYTPLIRLYEGKKVQNFYTEREFELYRASNHISATARVVYVKGLAGHTPEEQIKDIGANFNHRIHTFTWDEATRLRAEIMYGKSTAGRKEVLLTPLSREYSSLRDTQHLVSCSEHLDIEAKAFQQEFARRKIKSAIDGMIPTQRKALCGARRIFSRNIDMKVYQIGGEICSKMAYHHAPESINDAIVKMTQAFPGASRIPVFQPVSTGFGGRKFGRDKSGSTRYIMTTYNRRAMDLLFPPEDDCLLEWETDDGERVEPRWYVPIEPYSITESTTTVGCGWNINMWARDRLHIGKVLRKMIQLDVDDDKGTLPPVPEPLLGHPHLVGTQRCQISDDREITLGTWSWDADEHTISITELPVKIWSNQIRCHLLGLNMKTESSVGKDDKPLPRRDLVESVRDDTTIDRVDMTIKLVPGAIPKINEWYNALKLSGIKLKNIKVAGDKQGDSDNIDGSPVEEDDAEDSNDEDEGVNTNCIKPIEAYLGLYRLMSTNINMHVENGTVKEFKSYEEALMHWYPHRRALYRLRLERQRILLELLVEFHEQRLRFIEMDSKGTIQINRTVEEAERQRRLEAASFPRFNHVLLARPGTTATDELRQRIISFPSDKKPNSTEEDDADVDDSNESGDNDAALTKPPSYRYIGLITVDNKSKRQVQQATERLNRLKRDLEELKRQTWKSVWVAELNKLDAVVAEGDKTAWMFDRMDYQFEDAGDGTTVANGKAGKSAKPRKRATAAAKPRK